MGTGNQSITVTSELIERVFVAGHRIAAATNIEGVLQATLDALFGAGLRSGIDPVFVVDQVIIARTDGKAIPALTTLAAWDTRSDQIPARGTHFKLLTGRALDVIAQGEMLIVEDMEDLESDTRIDELDRAALRSSGFASLIIVPLSVQVRWLGLLMIGNRQPSRFSSDIVRMVQILADQTALGISRYLEASESTLLARENQPRMESSHMLGSMVSHAGDCIITTNLNREITSFNVAAETLYGFAATEVVGQPATMLVPYHRRSEYDTWTRLVLQEARALKGDSERIGKDGRIFPVYTTMWPLQDLDSKVYGIAEFTFDAGKQIAIQNALQKERDLLEAILEATNDAIIMIDTSRQIVAANLQFEVFFQLPRYELVNRTIDELVEHINAREDLPATLANLLLTFVGDSYQSAAGDFEMTMQERRVLIWYSTAVQANDGMHVGRLFVFRDATHEREVDRMKTEFVSLVSHELRTPLTSIKGFTDFILDGDAGSIESPVREYLNIVKFNADRLLSLINDILDITRIEAGRVELRREMHPIKALIDASMMSVRSMVQEREQRLTFTLENDLPQIWVDRNRIVQVMTNLISNASKYTPHDGTLRIEARMLKTDGEPVKNTPENVAMPAILLGVHDSGMGIPLKEQPFIFTRFYRTERATEQQIMGTGLGLAIVKSLVELHGGSVWLVSEVDHGSSFYFTIPLVEV